MSRHASRVSLATALRDHARARNSLDKALRLAGSADALEQAVIYGSFGRFLRRRGEWRAVRARLEDARDRFQALGATPFLAACNDELAACGVAPKAAGVATDDLTPQETGHRANGVPETRKPRGCPRARPQRQDHGHHLHQARRAFASPARHKAGPNSRLSGVLRSTALSGVGQHPDVEPAIPRPFRNGESPAAEPGCLPGVPAAASP